MNIPPSTSLQKREEELVLKQRLAARKGSSSTRSIIKHDILLDFREDFFRGHLFSREPSSLRIADLDTLSAIDAHFSQCFEGAVHTLHGVVFTQSIAITATNATVGSEDQLGVRGNGFRIVAPFAAERTALQEHGGPDSRSIMN